jgi:hypothetical protein
VFVDCTVVPCRTTRNIPKAAWINVLQVLFYVGLLVRLCFDSCEYYYALANICLNVDIFQVLPCLLTFRKAGCIFWCLDGTCILNVLDDQLFGRH